MRENLFFSNIPEKENEIPDVTEHILREFLELNGKTGYHKYQISPRP